MALICRVEEPSTSIRTGLVFCNDFGIEMNQAIALSVGLMEASSPLTSATGLGGLNR